METLSPRYIITRAAFLIVILIVVLNGYSLFKKYQRKTAIIAELKSITSDSSFFKQFYAEDAKKTLSRAIGLIAEANALGIPPERSINLGMGIKDQIFENDAEKKEPSAHDNLIRNCLRGNYENFLKFGFKTDFHVLSDLANGELPAIPEGPHAGRKPIIATLIDPAISPGLEKVIANLEIRPPQVDNAKATDIQIAAAKQLARELSGANIIEESVRDKIIQALSRPAP